jgi:hypothetical protein
MKGYYYDKDSTVVNEEFAVIYAPRRKRDRYPENCVEVVESAEQAIAMANPAENRYAAKVLGPARSSEGLKLFYLVAWLEEE